MMQLLWPNFGFEAMPVTVMLVLPLSH